jgi:hypothetical protein
VRERARVDFQSERIKTHQPSRYHIYGKRVLSTDQQSCGLRIGREGPTIFATDYTVDY